MGERHRIRFPLWVKLLLLLLTITLAPLGVVSLINSRRSVQAVEETALKNLELLASVTATRLDQLIMDTSRLQRLLSMDDDVTGVCSATEAERPARVAGATHQMRAVVRANTDIGMAMVLDLRGNVLAASDPALEGESLRMRDYVRQAAEGRPFVSDMLMGRVTKEPGVFFSGPVRGNDRIAGVLVLKLKTTTVQAICEEVRRKQGKGYAVVMDRAGIVLAGPRPDQLLAGSTTLPATSAPSTNPRDRLGERKAQAQGLRELARRVADVKEPGSEVFAPDGTGKTAIVAWAPMRERPWVISLVWDRTDFDEPLQVLRLEQLGFATLVAATMVAAALVMSRLWVRRIGALHTTADQIAGGNLNARASITGQDEVTQLAMAINEMVPKLAERSRMVENLRLAKEIQRNLLPKGSPDVGGIEVAGINVPADETGGDYYDFLDLSSWKPQTLAIAVGDVTGHGIPAALLMATARTMLRSRATPPGDPADLVAQVNARLCDDAPEAQLMTLVYVLIDRHDRRVTMVSAGHDAILHVDPATHTCRSLSGCDVPLGVDRNWKYNALTFGPLAEGSVLAIGTDGIWEAQDAKGEPFGRERLEAALIELADRSAQEIVDEIARRLVVFRGKGPQADDVTLVIAKLTPLAT